MRVNIKWTEAQMVAVVDALQQAVYPELEGTIAARIRAASAEPGRTGDGDRYWLLELTLQEGQVLKSWCDARRERTANDDEQKVWTAIVARVNEGVQWDAPAKN
jgi:hypothetical protein